MIVYDLSCEQNHRFEGWFGSSEDYAAQKARGLLSCPHCGSDEVGKAPMAPAVSAKGNSDRARVLFMEQAPGPETPEGTALSNTPMPTELANALETLAKAQAKALKSSTWVGDKFAEKARSMHYGEEKEQLIHGQASREDAEDLAAEGIALSPLLFPVAPPDELN